MFGGETPAPAAGTAAPLLPAFVSRRHGCTASAVFSCHFGRICAISRALDYTMKCCFAPAAILARTAGVVLVGILFSNPIFAQPSNGVLREVYLNIGGGTIPPLPNSVIFFHKPALATPVPRFR